MNLSYLRQVQRVCKGWRTQGKQSIRGGTAVWYHIFVCRRPNRSQRCKLYLIHCIIHHLYGFSLLDLQYFFRHSLTCIDCFDELCSTGAVVNESYLYYDFTSACVRKLWSPAGHLAGQRFRRSIDSRRWNHHRRLWGSLFVLSSCFFSCVPLNLKFTLAFPYVQAITARGGRFLEAPVIGSKELAKDGQLVILAAGDKTLYEDCFSCFQAMGRKMFHVGKLHRRTPW